MYKSNNTLIEFCNNNNFSDSESESSEEENPIEIIKNQPRKCNKSNEVNPEPSNTNSNNSVSPNDTKTIIKNDFYCEQSTVDIDEWENIELEELDDVTFDSSYVLTKEKTL